MGVAQEAAVAPAVKAGVGAGVGGEVAVAATPDPARLPVVGDGEGDGLAGLLFPTGWLAGGSGTDVQVSKELRVGW